MGLASQPSTPRTRVNSNSDEDRYPSGPTVYQPSINQLLEELTDPKRHTMQDGITLSLLFPRLEHPEERRAWRSRDATPTRFVCISSGWCVRKRRQRFDYTCRMRAGPRSTVTPIAVLSFPYPCLEGINRGVQGPRSVEATRILKIMLV